MKIIFPLNAKIDLPKLYLPKEIFATQHIKIHLKKFTIEEKKKFYNFRNLKIINKNDIAYDFKKTSLKEVGVFSNLFDQHDYIKGNSKITLAADTDNLNQLLKIADHLDFVLKIVGGCGFSPCRIESNSLPKDAAINFNRTIISQREKILNLKKIDRIIQVFKILNNEKFYKKYKGKIESIVFFLDTAMSRIPESMAGALYVTLLESIFVNNSNEIGFKLSMRLTKKRKQDINFRNKVKKLYDKRSKVFHGTGEKFTKEELFFLETEACLAIEEYIKNPQEFDEASLDAILLK